MMDDNDEEVSGWRASLKKVEKAGGAFHFFKELEKKEHSQQVTAQCIFCWKTVTSTGATRLAAHLSNKCSLCPVEVKKKFTELKEQISHKRKLDEEQVAAAREEKEHEFEKVKEQKQQLKQLSVAGAFKVAAKEAADNSIARFFYANGIPFSAASHEADGYYREMVAAIQKAGPTYVPPGAKAIGGRLIDACSEELNEQLAQRDANNTDAIKFGCTYVSDGWEDVNHTPLINSAYVTANDGGTYLRSVDTSGHTKDAEYLAQLMIDDIRTIGPTRVVAVCTDTCNSMKAAWRKVEAEFPWIFTVPCQAHCASLLSKDVAAIDEVASTVKEESMVAGWFLNHQKPLAILRNVTKLVLKKSLELRRAAATRFGTNTLVGQRQLDLKNCLQATVVDPEYEKMGYKDEPDVVDAGNGIQVLRQRKGGTVRKLILDDSSPDSFWSRVQRHVAFTLPVLKLIRRHDSSAPSVGKVYHGWFEVGSSMEDSSAPYASTGKTKLDNRWVYAHCSLFSAGYVLDPEFVDHDQASNNEVMTEFLDATEKIGILMAVREDVQKGLYDLVSPPRDAHGRPRFPTVADCRVREFCKKVNEQLLIYRGKRGIFSRSYVLEAAEGIPGHLWWSQYGSSVPELQCMAMLILAQPASASICERVNSEYGFIADRRRNRLTHDKANKLVHLFHNLRLVRKMNKVRYVEPLIGWGEGKVEQFGVTGDGAMPMIKVEV